MCPFFFTSEDSKFSTNMVHYCYSWILVALSQTRLLQGHCIESWSVEVRMLLLGRG